jgi:hypothetical protein
MLTPQVISSVSAHHAFVKVFFCFVELFFSCFV